MITTKFGTEVEKFISKGQDELGNWWIKCKLKGAEEDREIFLGDFRAEGGFKAIDAAIESLPITSPAPKKK